jgi:hypothetical protein
MKREGEYEIWLENLNEGAHVQDLDLDGYIIEVNTMRKREMDTDYALFAGSLLYGNEYVVPKVCDNVKAT